MNAEHAETNGDEGSLSALAVLSLVVGAASGVTAALFILALERADSFRDAFIVWAHGQGLAGFLLVALACVVAAGVAAWLVRGFSPQSVGSGIPHVEAVLNGQLPQARPGRPERADGRDARTPRRERARLGEAASAAPAP